MIVETTPSFPNSPERVGSNLPSPRSKQLADGKYLRNCSVEVQRESNAMLNTCQGSDEITPTYYVLTADKAKDERSQLDGFRAPQLESLAQVESPSFGKNSVSDIAYCQAYYC